MTTGHRLNIMTVFSMYGIFNVKIRRSLSCEFLYWWDDIFILRRPPGDLYSTPDPEYMLSLLSTRFIASVGVKWQCISQLKLYIWTTLLYKIGWDQHCTGDIFPVYVRIVTESNSCCSHIHCCVVSLSRGSVHFTLALPCVVAEDATANSLRLSDASMIRKFNHHWFR